MTLNILKISLKSTKLTKLLKKIIKPLLIFRISRHVLNRSYNTLPFLQKTRFRSKFSKIYCYSNSYSFVDSWEIKFINKNLIAPIFKDEMCLTWDLAISVLGHDIEVKQFYEKLLRSDSKPNIFFDVGANYGTHSLIFQSQGVETYSFEPNPNCYPYLEHLLRLNGLIPNIITKAVGLTFGDAVLSFPKKATWLGTLDQMVKENISTKNELTSINVEITSLDVFSKEHNISPDFIKIDTEGFELNVLSGAEYLLKNSKPIIVFECNTENEKNKILVKLNSFEYSIYELKDLKKQLDLNSFKNSKKTNFVSYHNSLTLPNTMNG
jgi:FkbM family methyltransferase